MKQLLTVLSILVVGLVAETPAQAPYAPRGWRPNGPAFELPQKLPQGPQGQQGQPQEYLPPSVDPRNPNRPNQEYGPPEVDVSVQGLPTQEQLPIFQGSPINGQQYVGSSFNSDIRTLDQSLKQSQIQQENYRQFARQQQLEAAQISSGQNPLTPRQFVQKTTPKPQATLRPDDAKTESTTEPLDLNQGEELDDSNQNKQKKVSVEVSKQRLQEFPPELFLGPLAQQIQAQLVPFQFNQLSAPLILQPSEGVLQKQVAGYDAATHFAAFPSVLAQQQLASQAAQEQQVFPLAPAYLVPRGNDQRVQYPQDQQVQYPQGQQVQYPQNQQVQYPQNQQVQYPQDQQVQYPQDQQVQYQQDQQVQYQQDQQVQSQPINQYAAKYPQFQMQPLFVQPQNQDQSVQSGQQPDQLPAQPQFVYQQYQPQVFQQGYQGFQQEYQPQEQTFLSPSQLPGYPTYPAQGQEGTQFQGQDGSLQSGFNLNQQGNGVETEEDDENDGATVTAVATAFGARTQPRPNTTYGAPAPGPRYPGNGFQTTTDSTREETTEDNPTVADAKEGRRSAKLRNRRVRPVFTLDKSGHLVLVQEQ